MDVQNELIYAVRSGRLEEAMELINTFGLNYCESWSKGYILLRLALKHERAEVAKLLLRCGSKVKSRNQKPSVTLLHHAVNLGDVEIVRMLLEKGVIIDAKDEFGNTALRYAIRKEKIEITEILLNFGAYVDDADRYGETNLYYAVERGCLEIVKLLLRKGALIKNAITTNRGKTDTLMQIAVKNGNVEMIRLLLSKGASVDMSDDNNMTCLHNAAEKGYTLIAEDLINHGACIHSLTLNEGYTPLHFASKEDKAEVVKLLLNKGADINVSSKENLTPLHIATKTGSATVVKLLLEHGAKIDNIDKGGKTILHDAVCGHRKAHKDIVKLLLEYGLIPIHKDANNDELLHKAVENGYLKIVEDLLNYGANVNKIDIVYASRSTLLHSATKSNQAEVAKLLIRNEADVNAKDKTGNTPIYYAIENSNLEITNLLLANGASVNNNTDIWKIAVKSGCANIVEYILNKGVNANAKGEALFVAVHYKREEVLKLLLERNTNVNYIKSKMTPIYFASLVGNVGIVRTLLWYGADINTTSCSRTPLDSARFRLRETDDDEVARICETIEQHIHKMKIANLYVSQRNLILTRGEYQNHNEYENEVTNMRRELINNSNTSFYDILAKDTKSLATYMRNDNIVQVLKSGEYLTKFPIYGGMIRRNFLEGMERKELIEQAYEIFQFHFKIELPFVCIENILSYLSNEDLRIWIDACKPISISDLKI